ncbi:hypothetical protein N9A94_03830 [Akkermansiaceae bacterium]|nr:hypothetical protein [Akkermansiaceae bacterium]
MMRAKVYVPFLLLLTVVIAVVIAVWPEAEEEAETWNEKGKWYKGNTHTHSLWSDGNDFPDMIVDWYKEQGYDFLALSDHNTLSRGEKWMSVKGIEKRRKLGGTGTLNDYLKRFGEEWVELRGEEGAREVRLKTLEEIRPRFEEEGKFLLIEAEEITDKFRQFQVHINAINLAEPIKPQHGESVVETMRNNLQAVKEQSERLQRPILTHLNHPNFQWSITPQQLAEVVEEQFFEVYNGHPGINHLGKEGAPGDEAIWDIANTLRLLAYKSPPLYGVATDDSHYYHGGNVSPGRGWVMVWSEALEADDLVEAMERGEFYASSGVVLEKITFDQGSRKHVVEIAEAEGVEFETRFVGTRRSTPENTGEVFATVSGNRAEYELTGDELYVRAVVTSSRPHPNPSYEGQLEQAWTQPVGWRRDLEGE